MDGGGVVKEVQQVVRHRLLPPTMPCSLFVTFCSEYIMYMYTDYVYIICIHTLYMHYKMIQRKNKA